MKYLPLRMKPPGAVFKRVTNTVFKGLQPLKVVIYIDNITVFSPNMEQHLIDLDLFFYWLAKANLKVSFTKCVIAQAKLKVLGHLMKNQGIKPNSAKVKTISQMRPPIDIYGV